MSSNSEPDKPGEESMGIEDGSDDKSNRFIVSFSWFHYLISTTSIFIFIYFFLKSIIKLPPHYPLSSSCGNGGNIKNLYNPNFSFDFYAFLNENETDLDLASLPIWKVQNLTYGDDRSVLSFSQNVSVSENFRTNGSLYLHVYLVKSGFLPGTRKSGSYLELFTFHKTKRLNFLDKSDDSSITHSYWYSNWTVNLVNDQSTNLEGQIRQFVDCEPMTGKYYPILYLNDKFNLVRDRIPIDRTTETLPLNLRLRQISFSKLEDYLKNEDLKKYRWHLNISDEDSLRERLIESDFDWKNLTKGDGFLFDHLKRLVAVVVLIKYAHYTLESKIWFQIDQRPMLYLISDPNSQNPNGIFGALFFSAFKGFLLLQLFPFIFVILIFFGLDISRLRQQYKTRPPDEFRLPSSVHLKHSMVFGNLVVFVLLPMLALYPAFSSLHPGYSTQECLTIFVILTIGSCFFYLSSIYWKAGLFLFDLNSSLAPRLHWLMIGYQFVANLVTQIAFMSMIVYNFDFVGFSPSGCLLFLFPLILSDLAVLLFLRKLAVSTHGQVFSAKFEQRKHVPPGQEMETVNRAYYPQLLLSKRKI